MKIKHHGNPAITTVRKIVSVVIFAMFLNILNLGAFVGFTSSISPSSTVLQLETELGRIYNTVNLPIKIVNDLFNKNKSMSDNSDEKNKNSGNKLFALFVPVKQAKKTGNMLLVDAIAPNNAANGNKLLLKWSSGYLIDMPQKYISLTAGNLVYDGIIRCMLLMLLIMLVLPRGIPVRIKNFININFAIPVFIFNKVGNFPFYGGCKGRVK